MHIVLRASGLTAKDANGMYVFTDFIDVLYIISCSCQPSVLVGLSDPYCHLGILNEAHKEKNTVKQKELQQWKKEKLVRSVASTKVKQATLEPEWNEDFYL